MFSCILMLRFRYQLLTTRAEKASFDWYQSVWNRFRSIKTFFASWFFVVFLGLIIMKWFCRLSYFTFITSLSYLKRCCHQTQMLDVRNRAMLLRLKMSIITIPRMSWRTNGTNNLLSLILPQTIFTPRFLFPVFMIKVIIFIQKAMRTLHLWD